MSAVTEKIVFSQPQILKYQMNTIFTLSDVENIVFGDKKIELSDLPMDKVTECYEFLKQFNQHRFRSDGAMAR